MHVTGDGALVLGHVCQYLPAGLWRPHGLCSANLDTAGLRFPYRNGNEALRDSPQRLSLSQNCPSQQVRMVGDDWEGWSRSQEKQPTL